MRILFWNVQRLGTGTPGSKQKIMEQVVAEAFHLHNAEFAVLCEVTSDLELGGVAINKQVVTAKRSAKGTKAQLGYAAIDDDLDESILMRFNPPSFRDVFGTSPWKKGGGEFTKQSKRHVACLGDLNGISLYVYHANASGKAAFLVGWVAEALHQLHNGSFVLMGDLNCEPAALILAMQESGSDLNFFNVAFNGNTHNAKIGVSKVYDYAVSGSNVATNVEVLNIAPAVANFSQSINPLDDISDHCPIIVTF
ncbi:MULTISPECIES: endonuclease/exonuclease/phosphatase family protein [Xanthomonas]|uniref:Endonuclease/exonuclease/phosphatase family protein n=1 Tax=Xanthomonas dyei TaxID=743699 RepID=A0ABZ0D7P9_9XANT|nr:endonuclease/exonuclease/phosphatase family protein [Xanthomonas dyei]MCC4633306.1 endonuclease/exonuclease/phosphatase family protein [Xanthomonas dyei pv. eucalypti]WOB26249.1 endonuclease/exonuclease/phosphatase family protein [Xanthomonas dyei]WOB53871.1 endonuclease/exonuclease/phosphatase family protein [Xanthomonas dyei]